MKVNGQLAFTRTELLVLLVFIMLTGAVVLPLLAGNTQRADRAVCFNNLRLIARAYHQWMTDHSDFAPWYVPVSKGGTGNHANKDNLWFQYWWLSDELVTPRILADPVIAGDERTRLDWAGPNSQPVADRVVLIDCSGESLEAIVPRVQMADRLPRVAA